MTTLISLLSDQTLPNVLFIEAVKHRVDRYVFLDTERSREGRKMDTIVKACNLDLNRCRSLQVDPEKYEATISVLQSETWDIDHTYLINITGGTKMMALAAKDFFWGMKDHEIYYIPVEHQKAYSLNSSDVVINLPEINLEKYLLAHAYTYRGSHELVKPHKLAAELFKEVIAAGGAAGVPAVTQRIDPSYQGADKQWFSGEWFEEWLYFKCREILKLSPDQISMKARLKHLYRTQNSDSDSEFDVLFVKNNRLYMLEAKVYTANKITATKSIFPLYKIASQQSTLGLHAQSIVVILAPLWNDKGRSRRIRDLQKLLIIKQVWDINDMKIFKVLIQGLI